MFEVFSNSIVNPKNIINYHSKKGGFVFLYILILVILMSLATVVFYISSKPELMTEETTSCSIVNNSLVCSGPDYNHNDSYKLYDFKVYFLSDNTQISEINNLSDFSVIIHGSRLSVVIGERTINSLEFLSAYSISTIEEIASVLKLSVIFAGVLMALISNTLILLFIIFISTIPFMRFKKLISYKKIFKMLVFASTPMAFLFAIYNLVNFDMIIFFILMLFAYRSVFSLQKEMHFRVLTRAGYYQEKPDEELKEIIDPSDLDDSDYDDDEEYEDEDENKKDE